MKKTGICFAVIMLTASLGAVVFAAPQNPDSSLLRNVPSAMPSPTARMSVQPYAYPTNRWWGASYIDNMHSGSAQQATHSTMMSLGTANIKFIKDIYNTDKVGVGYQLIASSAGVRSGGNDFGQAPTGMLQLCISSAPNMKAYIQNPAPLKVTSFSDWSVTAEISDTVNANVKMTTTFVKGGIFTYSVFSDRTYPYLALWPASPTIISMTDGIIISQGVPGQEQWYAVYAPSGTTFSTLDGGWTQGINLPAGERYLVTAYLGTRSELSDTDARNLFNAYRPYAYNFITDTKATWTKNSDLSITTTFEYKTEPKRTDIDYQNGNTLFALYPHQWRNNTLLSAKLKEYTTLRGKMQVYSGKSFQTKHNFYGVLPHLTYEVPASSRSVFDTYINNEKSFNVAGGFNNTYRRGKTIANAANLITVFHQAGKITERNDMIAKLKTELTSWYNGSGHFFQYDGTWGGIIPNPTSKDSGDGGKFGFGEEMYNDHHFHYGYFIYASAILAMYDQEFASSDKYKKITNLLVRDFASPDRPGENGNNSFPFLRNFDVYEGHSWANGKGASDNGDDGSDQESISEAMNAWAAIYLWGVVTNNDEWIKLGMYGYATESRASDEYYFDIYDETYPAAYTHRGGILFDSALKYITHWNSTAPQEKYGIWVLPLTPSMLYMGYDTAAANKFYTKMSEETVSQSTSTWRDILLRYKALYDVDGALSDWGNMPAATEGSSLSFSYNFIHFFREYGQVSTDYISNSPFFTAMKKGSQNTFFAFNNTSGYKTFDVYNAGGISSVGKMEVPPMTTFVAVSTNIAGGNFIPLKYDSLGAMYYDKNAGWYALGLPKYTDKVAISSFAAPATNPDCIYFPAAFEVKAAANNISETAVYIDAADLHFSSGTADKIRLAYYHAPESFDYPQQETIIKSSGTDTASLRIKANINAAGKYVLVMPFFSDIYNLGGQITVKGSPAGNIEVHIYDTVQNTTSTAVTAIDGKYSIANAKHLRAYIITPVSRIYEFEPKNFSYTVEAASKSDINFEATPLNKSIYAYPNPYKPSRHGNSGIRFANLKAGAQIKIFNIAGEMVFDAKADADGDYMWDVQNKSGYKIASGVYIYHIDSDGKVTKGKIAIER
ncbi:MAG: T9SS type A sorting domain-containing protein [Endomicrobium sp.]|nr:T9SS type A sorting domain-containing protein [Endomicrobium sp.]